MSKKNIVKITLDVIMTVILVLLYNSHVFALAFHEIAGLILAGMFVIHCLLNFKWVTSISAKFFTKTLTPRVRLGYIINFLLVITFALIITSGVMTSQVLFADIAAPKGSPWRSVHHFAGATAIILVGIHLGLHWGFISGMFKKIIRIPSKIAKPISIVLLIGILAFGSYSIATSSFTSWLTEPFISSTGHADEESKSEENGSEEENNIQSEKQEENKSGWDGRINGEKNENKNVPSQNGENEEGHPAGESKMEEGSLAIIGNTIATYLSIISVFATISYYLDKILLKKRKKNIVKEQA